MSIKVSNLVKSYGSQRVLDDISFEIGKGEIVAFLGNNGAGKSTTMKIINGYLSKDSGEVKVCGIDVDTDQKAVHSKIGYLPEHNPIYPDMYVKEYLQFIAGVYGVGSESKSRVEEMIEKTGLTREYKKRIGMLSKGYRQRVGLAAALIPSPEVLILDEPTTGLDPNQIVEVRNLIKEVGREKTIMLSTHIMQEVSAICDRVIILNKGKIVANESESVITHIHQDSKDVYMTEVEFATDEDEQTIREAISVDEVKRIGGNKFIIVSSTDVRANIFAWAASKGKTLLTLCLKEISMEEYFRQKTS